MTFCSQPQGFMVSHGWDLNFDPQPVDHFKVNVRYIRPSSTNNRQFPQPTKYVCLSPRFIWTRLIYRTKFDKCSEHVGQNKRSYLQIEREPRLIKYVGVKVILVHPSAITVVGALGSILFIWPQIKMNWLRYNLNLVDKILVVYLYISLNSKLISLLIKG